MIPPPVKKLLAVATIAFCLPLLVSAATLQAKVVEIQSGNTLIVTNTNRPLRIRLKAVVPPEVGQAFSDAAREHLRALVFEKAVTVDYTHLADGYLEAKVFLNGIDIGSQMLRDGVVWYNHSSDYQLTESDRDLYERCEQAARTEKRGLWQDPSPVAPWEFRRIQLAKLNTNPSETSVKFGSRKKAASQGFSNVDLLGSFLGSSPSSGAPTFRRIAENGSPDRWTKFESATDHFSILVPSNGIEDSYSGPDSSGRPIAAHVVAGGSSQEFYALLRTQGANEHPTDVAANDAVMRGLIAGMNQGARQSGSNDLISLKPVRQLKLGDYSGKQYNLTSEQFSGAARVYTRLVGDEREFFVLFVLTRSGSQSLAERFLTSFKVTAR